MGQDGAGPSGFKFGIAQDVFFGKLNSPPMNKHAYKLSMASSFHWMMALLLVSFSVNATGADWKNLFNGKDFTGWIQRGGNAKYHVEDGVIVGTTVKGGPNTFLCTDRDYSDFILELEYRVHPNMNSGVQIRSLSKPEVHNGVVHGYQVEIDPSKRAWSGGIYDESRRGWLNPLSDNPKAQAAFKQNEWNHYRVEAIGDSIKTWINGVPAADLRDSLNVSGFIALQVHGTNSDDPMQIRWRNVRIQDLGKHSWKPLFDGKTLNGWHALPGGQWEVVDSVIRGTSQKSEKRHGLLVTDKRFGNFTVRAQFKVSKGDSGFYFRVDEKENNVGVNGFQVEIDTSYETGGLYETGGRAWVVQHPADKKTPWFKKNEWNDLTVSAHGKRITVHVNGIKSAELLDDPGRTSGHIALQLHGGQDMLVEYRQIEILGKE